MKRVAVFCCMGLGDGLISMILSHNLQKGGFCVSTFHPFLFTLSQWFPTQSIQPFPSAHDMQRRLSEFERVFVFYEKSPAMQNVLDTCSFLRKEVIILNPIATKRRDYLYWENGKFDGTRSFASNLFSYCTGELAIKEATLSCGIVPPPHLIRNRYPRRVVLHPTSSRVGKNWSSRRFLGLAEDLIKRGYDPFFILKQEEKFLYPSFIPYDAKCNDLCDMAAFIYESGYMIGNDSGIGHLASSLGLPTLTISRSKMVSDFWRPSWSRGAVVHPPSWVPNIKGLRLRDRGWKHFISRRSVMQAFAALAEAG